MKTVILVDGFLFKGFLADVAIVKAYQAAGYDVVQFNYNNDLPTNDNIQQAAQDVRDLAISKGGTVVFVGVSMGSQVLCALLRLLGTQVLGDWSFILLANPEHAYTGRCKTPQYGGLGVPANTPYTVTDLAAAGDYWADAPASWTGWLWSLIFGNGIHTSGYFNLSPSLLYPFVGTGNIRHMWATVSPRYMPASAWQRPVTV